MFGWISRGPQAEGPAIVLEQLEDRIVLDGSVDDVSHWVEASSSQGGDVHGDLEGHVSEALAAESLTIDPLALETGTEWLQDGTWHYWEQDWDASGNGYRFDSWQDGSQSFHQIQWDAALNPKGTHNGFDYNLQRDSSWTYQAVQWDANANGYAYSETAAGTVTWETEQWSDGMGYSYTYHSESDWTYHVRQEGVMPGDVIEYRSDAGGFWEFCYTWVSGEVWHAGDAAWHGLDNGWMYMADENGHWMIDGVERFQYGYSEKIWSQNDSWNGWNRIGTVGLSSDFIGDGGWHELSSGWFFCYDSAHDTATWVDGDQLRFRYSYDPGQWWNYGLGEDWTKVGMEHISSQFIGDGLAHDIGDGWSFSYNDQGDAATWNDLGQDRFKYEYLSGQWWDYLPHVENDQSGNSLTVHSWGKLGPAGGMSQDFIGDGKDHIIGGAQFHYRSDPDACYYKWSISDADGHYHDYYQYNFKDGGLKQDTWYYHELGKWKSLEDNGPNINHDVRYLSNRLFVESYLHPDIGILTDEPQYQQLYEEQIRPKLKDISYYGFRVANNDSSDDPMSLWRYDPVVKWTINRPGSDNVWSGGDLNVAILNTWPGNLPVSKQPTPPDQTDVNQAHAEYTIDDTIVFTEDTVHSGLDKTVEWLGIVHDYYDKQISNVAIQSHGESTYWWIGEVISTRNYDTPEHVEEFKTWGTYMAPGAQILSYNCLVGQATGMLHDVAEWTNSVIFAHTFEVGDITEKISSSRNIDYIGAPDYHWNHNVQYIYMDTRSHSFDYQTAGHVLPHELFVETREF